MLYMILATDAPDAHELRLKTRPKHVARLQALSEAGRLALAGPTPMPDDAEQVSGSLIVAEFDSLDEAQLWAETDPYAEAGVYEEVLIKPFKQVFPA